MEILEELKHSWGLQRKDTESIKKRVLECHKDKDYKSVIELCSKLNYQKEPMDSEMGYALCYSIWAAPGNDIEAMNIAKKCAEYYDEPKFKEICSYAQEFWAKQRLKDAKNIKSLGEFKKNVEEEVIEMYEHALTWRHDNENLKKRIKKGISEAYEAISSKWYDTAQENLKNASELSGYKFEGKVEKDVITVYEELLEWEHIDSKSKTLIPEEIIKAYDAIGEKWYNESMFYADNWKERGIKRDNVVLAIPYFEKAKNNSRVSEMKRIFRELDAQIVKDEEKFGKPLNEFKEASGFCNIVIEAGYTTLGDFLKASDEEIDDISGTGPATMNKIKAFKAKF